jgi:hypothetical protein
MLYLFETLPDSDDGLDSRLFSCYLSVTFSGADMTALCALALLILQDEKTDPRFARLKAMAGEWEAKMDRGGDAFTVTYRVTCEGSVVIETLFAGTNHEMLTIYHMDGDDLVLTHYCAMRNQPHMKAAREIKGNELAFSCARVSNVRSHDDPHMHSVTLAFVDENTAKHAWTMHKGGAASGEIAFSLKRKK